MHFISFVKLFHFSLGIFHLFFIPLPRIFFISFLVPFHFFAWDIFHSLPGTFSFHCLGYFSFPSWYLFIPLPRIFFIALFHSLAWDILIYLPAIFSFSCLGYFSLRFFIPLPGIFSFICQQYFHSLA